MIDTVRGATAPSVVHVLPDKLGGVFSVVSTLTSPAPPPALAAHVVLTHDREDRDRRSSGSLPATTTVVDYSPLENRVAVLRRLAGAIPPGPGVLVAHDWLELAMLTQADVGRTVIFLLHGDYPWYYDLAERYQGVIDVFVGCSARIAREVARRLPHRAADVRYLPHGVQMPRPVRQAAPGGPLRLLFIGRLDVAKGILDLPTIDHLLESAGVSVRWTIVGAGPQASALQEAWPGSARVTYAGALTPEALRQTCEDHDVFVLPSRAEGFPIALLEAMGSGLVPVVTDLPSGVPELVRPGETGYRLPVGDVRAFANAIATLAADAALLERLSLAARHHVGEHFALGDRAAAYHALFAQWRELRRPRPARLPLPDTSRLDRRWIPNGVVFNIRRGMRWLRS